MSLSATAHRVLSLPLFVSVFILGWGCSSVRMPEASPVPCSRVDLAPAPPWTVTAAWDPSEEEMLLVDPGRHALVTYGRDGERLREVDLDAVAELNYSVPMRLQRVQGGYLLIEQKQIVHLGEDLRPRRKEDVFAGLEESQELLEGSLNDALLVGDRLYGYADFVDGRLRPEDDPDAVGSWRGGFVRLDRRRPHLDLLQELQVERGGEFTSYYLYGRRPYVAEVDGRAYVLRYTSPWSVYRVTRKGLRQVAAGGEDDGRAVALHGWNGRLYVLLRRVVETDATADAPTEPELRAATSRSGVELTRAEWGVERGRVVWDLVEVDPRDGHERREVELPSAAPSLHLVTGRTFWTAVEEGEGANLGHEGDRTSFLFLPARELLAGEFGCGPEEVTAETPGP